MSSYKLDKRIKIGSVVDCNGGYFVILSLGDLALTATAMYDVRPEVEAHEWRLGDVCWRYKRDLTIEEMLTHDNRLIRRLGGYVRSSY